MKAPADLVALRTVAAAGPAAAGDARARRDLAEAEHAWLQGDLDRAEALCRAAGATWGDSAGAGARVDLAALRAHLQFDRGDIAAALATLEAAHAVASAAGDPERAPQLLALAAYWALAHRFADAVARWGPRLQALRGAHGPAVAAIVEAYTAQVAMRRGELVPALVAFGRAYAHALNAGALRHAITAATNLSATWGNAGRADEALRWAEQALALARPLRWPVSVAQSLRMLGVALHNLGRLEGARAALEEALQLLSGMPASRHAHGVRMALADVHLAQGAPRAAEAIFAAMEAELRAQGEPELLSLTVCARAEALHAAGDRVAADRLAQEALTLARRDGARLYEIDALNALAAIHAGDDGRARGHLEAALACGRGMPRWTPPVALLAQLADCCLRQGDARSAWPLLQEAHRVQQVEAQRRAQQRAALAEAAYTLARERAAAESARREARRREREAALIAEANRTLASLGRLGRRLLLETRREAIVRRLEATAPRWLPVSALTLRPPGAPLPPADPGTARLVWRLPRQGRQAPPQGTLVATLRRPGTRADRHLLRTLSAWVALACARAAALQALQQAQAQGQAAQAEADHARERLQQAVEQRRRFAGFISHDLRSPLAALQGLLDTLRDAPPGLSADDRRRHARQARAVAGRLQAMVGELGSLAADPSGMLDPQRVPLSLPALVQRVFAHWELEAARRGLRLELWREADLPPALADAGMVERVLMNLVDNAVRHAAPGGRVRVELACDGTALRVAVLNDGEPVAPERRPGLFRWPGSVPVRQRSAGLGLPAVQRLLALHGSAVRAPGRPGWATAFEFNLPAAPG